MARHVPRAWDTATPEASLAAPERGSVAALRRILSGGRDGARGLIDVSGWLSAAGRETKEWIESRTDHLAAPAYDSLEPVSALDAAGSR